MQTRKTLNKLIKNYQVIFTNLGFKINPNFKKDFLHIKRMKGNGTKISFIKADKIKGLQENIKDFKLKPNSTEQREKYFTAVKPSKFLNSMILPYQNKEDLFNKISEQFTKDFIFNLKSNLVLFSGDELAEAYSINSSIVGCMSGNNANWFNVYAKTENLQLATLQDDSKTMLIRSLLWYDKENNNYWLDSSYEQSAINGDNEIRKDYQKKLLCQVLEHLKKEHSVCLTKEEINFAFGCSFAGRLDSSDIEEIEKQYSVKIFTDVKRKRIFETINTGKADKEGNTIYKEEETQRSKDRILLKPIIVDYEEDDFTYFPYSDTFQSIGRHSGRWFITDNAGDNDFICCRSQHGEDENADSLSCESCGEHFHEDEIFYSEIEEEYLCDECSIYVEERDSSVRESNAIYNNYTGNYHYRYDIDS